MMLLQASTCRIACHLTQTHREPHRTYVATTFHTIVVLQSANNIKNAVYTTRTVRLIESNRISLAAGILHRPGSSVAHSRQQQKIHKKNSSSGSIELFQFYKQIFKKNPQTKCNFSQVAQQFQLHFQQFLLMYTLKRDSKMVRIDFFSHYLHSSSIKRSVYVAFSECQAKKF